MGRLKHPYEKPCECGCGGTLLVKDKRYFRFIQGHNHKSTKFGEDNAYWRGGITIDGQGYRKIRRGRKYIGEHIIIFERYYDCCILLPWGNVHHKDGNRQNNEITNLEGMTRAQHSRLHHINGIYGRWPKRDAPHESTS